MKTIFACLLCGSVTAFAETNLPGATGIPPVSPNRSASLAASRGLMLHQTGGMPVPLTPEFINQLAEEMRTNSPAFAAARARTNAAALGVVAVRTWDDPMAKVGGMAAAEMMRQQNGDVLYGVEQKLPLFGRPAAARRVATAELNVEIANAEAEFQSRRRELANALFRAALAVQVVSIADEDLAFLDKLVASADARYRSGEGKLTDVLNLQNERARRADQLISRRAELEQTQFALNRLLNRPPDMAWPQLVLPPVAGPVIYSERLVKFARDYEPKLHALRQQVAQVEALTDQTRRTRYPDVSVEALSRNYSGTGEFRQAEFMLSFSLPFLNSKRYRADLARDSARTEAARFAAADYELSLREEVHGLTVKIDAARREALLYRDEILPRTEKSLGAALAAWQSGSGMFADVMESRRMRIEARLMQVRAVAEQWQMLADLVLCCGLADFGALQMIRAEPAESPARDNSQP